MLENVYIYGLSSTRVDPYTAKYDYIMSVFNVCEIVNFIYLF